ncbi:sensor histidine kinase [Larkinella punicea]|uniref:histidine kinase n=1 Tax=Larkinella punicea TaxID=2315727 RepID=A0A368JS91_9BACT|nr:ATP-binding protein [Larkinella punicea]RCR70498.1 PAS domain-containing protein [Larkinella punicea]
MKPVKTYEQLVQENEALLIQLEEATETIHAIRTGQVDALVVQGKDGHELYSLKTADQTYRVFIETMNEGAVTLNEAGLILYCNSKFASMVGMPLSKVIALSFDTFIPAEYKDRYNSLFNDGWTEDRKVEICILSTDREVPCQLSVTTLELDGGTSMSVIVTDLTVQKATQRLLKSNNDRLEEMNTALEVSNHDLQQFASVASHDLQEPLRKIQMFSELLKDKHIDELPIDSVRYLEKIIDSSNRMRTMIIDILSYSRLSTHSDTYVLTDLNKLLNEVLKDFELRIQEKKARVQIDPLPEVEVNQGQIRQVFQNLISNALKFSKANQPPVIEIKATYPAESETKDEEPMCSILITDNGIGFDEQYVDKIFSLFQRLNTKDIYEGSGIGLAVTKRIIDKHNGRIRAQSKEGMGSTFIISLPLRQHKPA